MKGNKSNNPVQVSLVKTQFKSNHELTVNYNRTVGILEWGRKNERPVYLLSLYNGQPQHQGIVNGKARYLAGTDIKGESPQSDEFIKRANPKESWQDLRKKYLLDYTLYGGYAIKVVPNLFGDPIHFYHLDRGKMMPTECGKIMKYCDDWSNWRREEVIEYPVWYPGCTEISVMLYGNYAPTVRKKESMFPALEYEAALKDIDTLKRIQNSRNSLVINDFTSSTVVTIFGGKPKTITEEEIIANKIKGNHTGDEEFGKIIVLYADPDSKPADIQSVPTNELDKKYLEVTTAATKNVYSAHNAPPDLFNYISDTSTVFDVNKIVEQNEWFMNAYVIPNQESELKVISNFFELRFGVSGSFVIEQFKPIGVNVLDPNLSKFLTNDEIREKMGLMPAEKTVDNNANKVIEAINSLSPLVANKVLESMNADEIRSLVGLSVAPPLVDPTAPNPGANIQSPVKQIEVNEHLKNLTGKQNQGIMRIVRNFQSGKINESQARILLKSFGLTDSEMGEFLGIQQPPQGQMPIKQRIAFAKQVDFFALFDKYAHDVNPEDEVLETNFIDGKVKFAESVDVKTNTAVLNELKKNKEATNEEIATTLGITLAAVASAITWLTAKKLLSKVDGVFQITQKGLDAKKTVIYTEYNYDKRPEVPGPVIMATTRDFCRMLYAKFQEGKKALSFELKR